MILLSSFLGSRRIMITAKLFAVSGDVGQATELEGLEEKAKKTGASKLYIEDL